MVQKRKDGNVVHWCACAPLSRLVPRLLRTRAKDDARAKVGIRVESYGSETRDA